jgi:acyl carrier protein phosphodiesterase
MNFLNHLYFSNESVENTTGLIIGNCAKEVNLQKYNLEILKGMAVDLQIRNFTEKDPAFNRSIERMNTKFNKYSTFIVNIFYDHFLAKNWEKYSDTPLDLFADKMYQLIMKNHSSFPYKIRKFAPEMITKKWITSVASIDGTHQYIKLLSKTERFTTNLDQCLDELIEKYQAYSVDFEEYFTALNEFMKQDAERFTKVSDEELSLLIS